MALTLPQSTCILAGLVPEIRVRLPHYGRTYGRKVDPGGACDETRITASCATRANDRRRVLRVVRMAAYLLNRFLLSFFVVLLVSFLIFSLAHLTPGSPATAALGPEASPAQIARLERSFHLDKPILVQYAYWLSDIVLHGDFGTSYVSNAPATRRILETVPVTFELIALATMFAIIVPIPAGIVSALTPNSIFDHVLRITSIMGLSVPNFWLGILLIIFFGVTLHWLPAGNFIPLSSGAGKNLSSLVLPSFVLGFYYMAVISRMMRSSLLDTLQKDYTVTAAAMGLARLRILTYALKNALAPVVSVVAMAVGYMMGWAIVVESVFNLPGLGTSLITGLAQRDYPIIEADVLIITCVFVFANFAADMLYAVLNPKIVYAD